MYVASYIEDSVDSRPGLKHGAHFGMLPLLPVLSSSAAAFCTPHRLICRRRQQILCGRQVKTTTTTTTTTTTMPKEEDEVLLLLIHVCGLRSARPTATLMTADQK